MQPCTPRCDQPWKTAISYKPKLLDLARASGKVDGHPKKWGKQPTNLAWPGWERMEWTDGYVDKEIGEVGQETPVFVCITSLSS